MKKLFSLLLPFIIGANLSAQKVTTSFKAGFSFATLHFKTGNSSEQGRLAGYGGLSFKVSPAGKFYFQPEALYSIRGYRVAATNFSNKGRISFGYITVPLLAGYALSKNFSILAGPELGYMIRARAHSDDGNYDLLSSMNRKFNIDADAGIAWNITKELCLETRFSFGVTAVYRGVLTDQMGNPMGDFKDGYHRVLQLGLSFAL